MNEIDQEILAEDVREEKRRRGISFLPNALTTGAMFFGFYSIMQAVNHRFDHAAWALLASGVLDLLDGRVARLTRSSSAFGAEYDSLADLISFGFAPAMLVYQWALSPFGRLGWAAAFIYLACAAIRLAKFNTLSGEPESKLYFHGIPSPPAAGLIVTPVLIHVDRSGTTGGLPLESGLLQGVMLAWVILISLLMVSNVRFRTFKDINLRKFGPVLPLVGFAAIIAFFMARPQETLFTAAYAYLLLGLIEGGIIIRRREGHLREELRLAKKQRRVQRKLEKRKAKLAHKEEKLNPKPPVRAVK